MTNDQLRLIAIVGPMIVGAVGLIVFHVSKDAKLKRRWFPWYMIFAGAAAVVFAVISNIPKKILLILVPFVIISLFLTIRSTRFL